jgi:C-terminal processing protease CtpA/Prc
MIRALAGFLCASLAPVSWGQNSPSLADVLSFETAHTGACPLGWSCAYPETVSVDGDVVHSGKWSVRIERKPGHSAPFSGILKNLPIDFSGSKIELRGYIRSEDVQELAAFWMREDSAEGSVGFATMQGTHPVKGTTGWAEYSISLPLNPDARTLFFGFLLNGPGKAWADDLQLLVDGKAISEAPKIVVVKTALDNDHEFDAGSKIALNSLRPLQIENLTTLGKVWGFLKYHHPQITSGSRHFDYDLFRVLPSILAAPDHNTANAAMVRWIAGLGDVADCAGCAPLNEHDLDLRPDLNWISDQKTLGDELSGTLRFIHNNRPRGSHQFYVSIPQNVGNPSFQHEPNYQRVHLPDAGFQILSLYRFWNIIEYWYPYHDGGKNWNSVLSEFLPRIALAKDADSYKLQMMALIARVEDTHANLWSSMNVQPPVGACQVPVNLRFVENQAVVASYSNPEKGKATGLEPGDVVLEIDGVAVSKLVADLRPFYAASNEPTRLRDIGRGLTRGDCSKPVNLRIRRGIDVRELAATRLPMAEIDYKSYSAHDLPGDTFQLLSPEIAYLKLSSVKISEIPKYLDSAVGTKGLIIDIRNYPSEFVVFALGQHLVDKPTPFVRFTRGDQANPGAFHWDPIFDLTPALPHYSGKIVILVDEVSQSQAEYTTMAFRAVPGAVVIGSTTAGADGNVSEIPLPGMLRTMISGIGVFYPDRRPTQRIGIIADQEVKPTIEGIRQGRDELIEAAKRAITH